MIIALQNIIFLLCKIIQLRRCSFNNPNVYKKYDSIINHIKVDVPLTSFSFIQSKYVTPIYPFYRTMPFPKVVKAKNIYSYIWHNVILKQIGFILFIFLLLFCPIFLEDQLYCIYYCFLYPFRATAMVSIFISGWLGKCKNIKVKMVLE